jgi:hypothetical protein
MCDSKRKPRGLDRSAWDMTCDRDRFALVNPRERWGATIAMLDFPASGQAQFTFDVLALDQARKAWHTRVGAIQRTHRAAFQNDSAGTTAGARGNEIRLQKYRTHT